jgi:ubiquitin C-terminal hydrolase
LEQGLDTPRDPTSVTYDHFTSLSLAVNDAGSLATCMHKYMADEVLTDISSGGRLTRRFTYLPRVLIVHLKRFDAYGSKIDKFVDYPFELSLGQYVSRPEVEHNYQLFAVCLHHGSSHDGHYTACCEVQGTWFMCDDASVTPLEHIDNVIQRDAYVLMYRRL